MEHIILFIVNPVHVGLDLHKSWPPSFEHPCNGPYKDPDTSSLTNLRMILVWEYISHNISL